MSLAEQFDKKIKENEKKELDTNPHKIENAIKIWLDALVVSLIEEDTAIWSSKIKQLEEAISKNDINSTEFDLLIYNGNDEIYEGIKHFDNRTIGLQLSDFGHRHSEYILNPHRHSKNKKFNNCRVTLRPILASGKESWLDYICCTTIDRVTGYKVVISF